MRMKKSKKRMVQSKTKSTCKYLLTIYILVISLTLLFRLSFMGGILPKYFKSEWSFAQLRITDGGRAICAFNEDASTLIAVTTDGQYYISEIPKGGGECEIKDKRHLINDS